MPALPIALHQRCLVCCLLLLFTALSSIPTSAQEPIRIGFIDPLSGAFAAQGTSALSLLQFTADYLYNSKAGVLGGRPLEIVPLDNKQSSNETQIQLRRAIGEKITILFQGTSSAIASTLVNAINKHNRRNPEERVLYLNYAAVDPQLTNSACSFWHFRFDAHTAMKLNALTDAIALNPGIKRMYLIGQDYSFGKDFAGQFDQRRL